MRTFREEASMYLKDSVYAANDGIVTTFAVVASAVGASFDPVIVLVLGFANLFADGFAMATGNFLGSRSESYAYRKERRVLEEREKNQPADKRKNIEEILTMRGYAGNDLGNLTDLVIKNKQFATDLIMNEEVGIEKSRDGRSLKSAIATFVSFVIAGLVPLLPYIMFGVQSQRFVYATVFTGIALFGVGVLSNVIFTDRKWFVGGMEVLVLGGIAAAIAYAVGALLRGLVNGIV